MERLGLGRTGEQAFQNYETQLHLLNQHIQQRRLKYESVESTQAWEEPSTETPAQHSNFINYVGPQKRKRGNETERRVTRSGGVSSGMTSGEPSPHISVSMVRDGEQEQLPHRFDLIYQISCDDCDPNSHPATAFRDVPTLDTSDPAATQANSSEHYHLNGTLPIFDLEAFLNDQTSNAAFVVVRTVACSNSSLPMADVNVPLRSTEKIYAVSKPSKDILQNIARCHFRSETDHEHNSHQSPDEETGSLRFPYPHNEIAPLELFLFHHQSILEEHIKGNPTAWYHVSGLFQYSEARYGNVFKEVEALFARSLVSREHITKLYRPNDIVVAQTHGQSSAFVVHDWPQLDQRNCIILRCWSYQTDGSSFARKLTLLSIPAMETDVAEITSLVAYPLRFASTEIQESVLENGRKQWDLRIATHVTYKGWNVERDQYYSGSRFMVDHETYHKMDEGATAFTFDKPESVHSHDTMPVCLSPEDQHSQVVFSLLSPTIHGFDLNEKRWIHLRLDSVHSVSWNKESYDRLVLPDASKDLLRTLVLAQQSRRRLNQGIDVARVDIMGATSHRLTVLLYGGPGTGKTFSTESIAEIAERPLYRINCGDVGMNADAIEEFAFVLGVGKAWNCVLLLDKAHVLLQRRSTSDSQSDSLISSFLHMLEHYDGIVVLTSSHLDGLDEALVSRIQVVLQCKNLDHSSRKKIWQNFIDKFEEDQGSASFEEIRSHLDDLAEKDLNGHQIRNVFKTAKELATFREECLDWGQLQQALSLSSGSTARRV